MHRDEGPSIQVDFEPIGKRVQISAGQTLLEAAQKGGIAVLSVCGGNGTCQDCRVKVMQGQVSDLTPDEEAAFTAGDITSGYRLACQTRVLGDCKIDVPPDSLSGQQRLQLESLERTPVIHPMVRPVDITLPFPAPGDTRSDVDILLDALTAAGYSGLTCSESIIHVTPNQPAKGWPKVARCHIPAKGHRAAPLWNADPWSGG